jgi:hypothetical protein
MDTKDLSNISSGVPKEMVDLEEVCRRLVILPPEILGLVVAKLTGEMRIYPRDE